MDGFQYKAFISYSHKDEAWASWLHRALETYRVPKRLVGRKGPAGQVEARIVPIFRDRDELSTAPSLSENILQGLQQSESLIILCSPAAATSQWVNQEIRMFRTLGRNDRIFCVVVDGDPGARSGPQACFPPALFEGADETETEPLAADPRKWADGKPLAKLKLIAGLLGIGLDELRQRDLHRRQRWAAITALGVVAGLVLASLAVIAQISERHEREKAEQLATFIVDLGERVQSDVDLETLAIISSEASKHLESLDPEKLSPETSIRVGLAIRQMGRVSEQQGRITEAFDAYSRSRDLFVVLRRANPGQLEILFELGQAEYWIGNLHLRQGDYVQARQAIQRYHQVARTLAETDPENPEWTMELSYSLSSLAALQLDSGKGVDAQTLANLNEAIQLIEKAMALAPADHTVVGHYATTLAWAADAHLMACELENARPLRERTLELAATAHRSDPSDNELKRRYAFARFGLARVETAMGELQSAESHMRQSINTLEELAAADPSNVLYQDELNWQRFLYASLLGETGRISKARPILASIEADFESRSSQWNAQDPRFGDYVDFLLGSAEFEKRNGNTDAASQYLRRILTFFAHKDTQIGLKTSDEYRLLMARVQWWEIHNRDLAEEFPFLLDIELKSTGEYRDCLGANVGARLSVMEQDREAAARQAAYLEERAYAEPSYMRFCKSQQLCTD